jgi:hypothetical protein
VRPAALSLCSLKEGRERAMPEISEDQFHVMVEIQDLARIMKRCSSIHEPAFQRAQAALTMALNRLSSLPTLRDRATRPGGIEV